MNFNSILHIGAGKCGSSSLQSSLSRTGKQLCTSDNIHFEYVAIRDNGEIFRSEDIQLYLQNTGYPSISSFDITSQSIDKVGISLAASQLNVIAEQDVNPVLSCEGWTSRATMFQEQQILEKLGLQPSVIMFVRPPLDWINSAWWQWGAWQNIDFNNWLDRQVKIVNWTRWIQEWKQLVGVQQLNIRLATGDVVESSARTYGLEIESKKNTNVSSSPALLRFLQRNRHYRTGPHDNFVEKQLSNEFSADAGKPPWIIPKQHQSSILASLRQPYQELLNIIHPDDREKMAVDQRWWNSSAYSHRHIEAAGPIDTVIPDSDRALEKCLARIRRRAAFKKVTRLPQRLRKRLS